MGRQEKHTWKNESKTGKLSLAPCNENMPFLYKNVPRGEASSVVKWEKTLDPK